MKLTFAVDFDGALDIQPGDSLELLVTGKGGDEYQANIVRQTGVRDQGAPAPDLGVNVSDSAGISDRLG